MFLGRLLAASRFCPSRARASDRQGIKGLSVATVARRTWDRLSAGGRVIGTLAKSRAGLRAVRVSAAVAALAVVLGLAYAEARPTVRLVNASHLPVFVLIDGRPHAVAPTSTETAGGGTVVRLSPGTHRFAVEGGDLDAPPDRTGSLYAYGQYLFAASDGDQCFSVERTTYGRGTLSGPPTEALDRAARLWALPASIDAVFSPNPPPLPGDRWSTGGERIALRQRRCDPSP